MSVTIYHNPACGTSRNTLAMIRESGEEPAVVEYLKTPPDRATLRDLIRRMGIAPRELLRRKGTPYNELGLDDPKWSDEELIGFMLAHPILINRPIVVTPKGIKLCRPSEAVLDILPNPHIGTFTKEDGEVVRPRRRRGRPPSSVLRSFLDSEALGGVILMVVAAIALVVANTSLAPLYFGTLDGYVAGLSVLHWINDALMAVFFLLVGLEIKRELLDGELSTWPRRILPGIAAVGGMAFPAIVYVAINASTPETLRGWAIPAATDIAFALGVLALLGPRVPVSLKIFLTALAIIDDLGAVAIIAAFYTEELALGWLALAAVALAALGALNRFGVRGLAPFLLLGAALWYFTLHSGVHPTLAGIALALTIPLKRSPGRPDDEQSPLHRLEHAIQPLVAFAIVPIFGFANAGVSLAGFEWATVLNPVTSGIAAGLFLGKQIGVFLSTWLVVKLGLADCPENASWTQVYGMSLLAGIGFTMSLFVGLLAFPEAAHLQDNVKVGVLAGSIASALVGAVVLHFASFKRTPKS